MFCRSVARLPGTLAQVDDAQKNTGHQAEPASALGLVLKSLPVAMWSCELPGN